MLHCWGIGRMHDFWSGKNQVYWHRTREWKLVRATDRHHTVSNFALSLVSSNSVTSFAVVLILHSPVCVVSLSSLFPIVCSGILGCTSCRSVVTSVVSASVEVSTWYFWDREGRRKPGIFLLDVQGVACEVRNTSCSTGFSAILEAGKPEERLKFRNLVGHNNREPSHHVPRGRHCGIVHFSEWFPPDYCEKPFERAWSVKMKNSIARNNWNSMEEETLQTKTEPIHLKRMLYCFINKKNK
jgi:hypothetical protein